MTRKYDFGKVERKWQEVWEKEKTYEPDFKNVPHPFYNLMMFPYPSAEGLHIGGVRTFTGVDIYGRLKRMQGHDVFEPMGLDGFGIHSENYALKIGAHPASQAKVSEKRFYEQLAALGNGFAWDEKLETYAPEYYKWTQWISIQLFKRGLAYRKKQPVNWCPSCKTVLADEQVIQKRQGTSDKEQGNAVGVCERCETPVIKKELEQWFFKTTAYAERLLKNLDTLDWSENVKTAQKNWIGRSEGALIKFPISNYQFSIEVFTTRPDTIFGATYLVLAPEHEFIANNELRIANHAEVKKYIEIAKKKSDEDRSAENKEKTGVELKGIKAINPANKEEIPIWVADYVFGGYGTGAIMAVPAHDERDFEFAKKFNLPIRYVVAPHFIDHIYPPREGEPFEPRKAVQPYVYNPKTSSYLFLDWKVTTWKGPVSGGIEEGESTVEAAQREVHEETGYKNIRFIRELGSPIKCDFYHPHKKVNRSGEFIGLLFELVDEAKDEVSEEEKKKHEFCWVLEQETLNFINEGITFFKRIPQSNLAYVGNGTLINSEKFSGKKSEEVKKEITDFVGGKWKVQYRLRDWLISRQRYWGPPIPIIYCRNCWEVTSNKEQGTRKKMREGIDYAMFDGEEYVIHPVPEEDLPVELPYVKDFRPQGKGESPLASVESFYKVKCPACKGEARRETDVSDTFLDSAWYFLRYPSVTRNKEQGTRDKLPWDKEITRRWLPVNMYIGGAEHSVLHLLYSRFITMALHDMKLLHFEEPFTKFRAHGLITKDGAKMSKSKGNVVTPDEYFGKFGADVMRMYLAFMAPLDQGGDFREGGILGPERFLKRVWKFYSDKRQGTSDKEQVEELERLAHRAAKKVTEDIENLHYNTAISALMVLLNKMEEVCPPLSHAACPMFLKLLAPFAPFMTEEIWQNMAKSREQRAKSKFKSIHQESWPEYDPKLIIEDTFTLVIQVNGKVRDTVGGVQANISEDEARALALSRERILAYAGGKEPKKVIYIPNRLVNVVI